jgi:hypothetical protein
MVDPAIVGRKKATVAEMKAYAKSYKSKNCPAISKMRKNELQQFVNSIGFLQARHGAKKKQRGTPSPTTSTTTAPARSSKAAETLEGLQKEYKKIKSQIERLTNVGDEDGDVLPSDASSNLQKVRDLNKKQLELFRKIKDLKLQQKK